MEIMAAIINVIGERMREGLCFEDWRESDQIAEGYRSIFRRVARDFYPEYFGYAMWFYEYKYFPVLQCVWPDKNHRYRLASRLHCWHEGNATGASHEIRPKGTNGAGSTVRRWFPRR